MATLSFCEWRLSWALILPQHKSDIHRYIVNVRIGFIFITYSIAQTEEELAGSDQWISTDEACSQEPWGEVASKQSKQNIGQRYRGGAR